MSHHSLPATENTTEDELKDFRTTLEKSFHSQQYTETYKQLKALSAKVVNRDLLKATSIGKLITTLSLAEVPSERGDLLGDIKDMKALAKEILEAWKKVVLTVKTAKKEGAAEESPKLKKSMSISTEATITRNGVEPYIPDGLKIDTGNDSRNKIVISFIKYLQKPAASLPMDFEEVLVHAAKKAIKIEEAIFAKCKTMSGGVDNEYLKRARVLLANIGDDKNPKLKMDVLNNVLTPEFLAKCEPKDLASSELKLMREKMAKDGLAAARTDI